MRIVLKILFRFGHKIWIVFDLSATFSGSKSVNCIDSRKMSSGSLVQSWRRFPFFDQKVVTEPENPEQPYLGLQDINVVTSCSGNGQVFLGDRSGCVFRVVKRFADASYFRAHKSKLYAMCYVKNHNILFTAGDDDDGVNPFIKAWNLDKVDKQGTPFCCRCTKTSPNNRPIKVTALAVHSSMQYLAIGFEDSSLLLCRGDAAKEKQNKPQMIQDGLTSASDGSVVGLAFHQLPDKSVVLYSATTHTVVSYLIPVKDKNIRTITHGQHGCMPKCWSLADQELDYQFIVARRDGVYFYLPEERGGCQLFEGEKVLIKAMRNYLVVVVRDSNVPELDKDVKMNMVTVYDMTNSYIAHSALIPDVVDVFYEWGSFFVLTKLGKIFELIEKDTQTKLDILFRKNLYDVAVKLAEHQNMDGESLSAVCQHYGDFLYQKGDYVNAVKQYARTIGTLEPSYVIRKFLDSQRIAQLTEYLEALHKANVATKDHTTILLNCYTKLNSSAKIEQFAESSGQAFFDVDTAIRVLRSAGYVDFALRLAKQHLRRDLYLHMLLEDKKDYESAVRYIADMEFEQAETYLRKYGTVLMVELPEKTTDILKRLCTVGFPSEIIKRDQEPRPPVALVKAKAEDFIHIFVNNAQRLQEFLEHMIKADQASAQPVVYNTLLELYLQDFSSEMHRETKDKLKSKIMAFLQSSFSRFDFYHALLLCQTNKFDEGTLFLYEKGSRYEDVLRHFIEKKDFRGVIDTCMKYATSTSGKDMWIEALRFFAQNECPSDELVRLLERIQQLGILPPLMVLEILSHSHTVTLGVVKDYLLNWLNEGNRKIGKYEAEISHYQEEIGQTEEKIQTLTTKPQEFQISKCSACNTALEVPTVHFLCKHSYHEHCFENYAYNDCCPTCSRDNKYREIQAAAAASQEQNRDLYQQLQADLKKPGCDPLATISEYFGKGIFQSKPDVPASKPPSKQKSMNPFDE